MNSTAINKEGISLKLMLDSFECMWIQRDTVVSLDVSPDDKVRGLYCHRNLLTELVVPEGVFEVWCQGNQLTKLELPKSLTHLTCDKELFDYEKCEIHNVSIMYLLT